jgi:Tfp pilus assembly protein PilO
MKITPLQQYIILGVLGFLVLSFLFYQFGLKPINREISSLEVKRDQEKKDLDEAKKIVAKYVEFKKRADSIQRELEWIQNRIPKTIDKSKLVEVITSLQNRSGVSLTDFRFSTGASTPSANSSYTEIPVNIKFNSDYDGLLKFLYQMSLSNLIMTARDVVVTAITPMDSTHPNATLSTQMVLSGIQAK